MDDTTNELCIVEDTTDLITSFENPNYVPTTNRNNMFSQVASGRRDDCDGNCGDGRNGNGFPVLSSSELEKTRSAFEQLWPPSSSVTNENEQFGEPCFYHREETPSSTDSAISSPSSDFVLVSPYPVEEERPEEASEQTNNGKKQEEEEEEKEEAVDQAKSARCRSDSERQNPDDNAESQDNGHESNDTTETVVLPIGWQKCDDADGAYYWHIKSGTIQREVPDATSQPQIQSPVSPTPSASNSHPPSSDVDVLNKTPSKKDDFFESQKSTSTETSKEAPTSEQAPPPRQQQYPIRFAVRSLGWVAMAEEELSQERSSRAVNKCIVDLSIGKKDINDVVGRWGDGKYLYMDLDQENLSLIDPHDLTVLNVQPIRTIRVWGVGRDNDRDFAYVARDRTTRHFMCHVFRCELPARHIAATLCEVCRLIVKRNAVSQLASNGGVNHVVSRPTHLPSLERNSVKEAATNCDDLLKNSSFPTPMDEPKKIMTSHYLGTIQVSMPTGVEVLNGAIDMLNARIPPEKWTFVNVTVAPSTITISEHERPDNVIAECRVRFLSFLGISLKNIKFCSFIIHTAQDQFVAHVFYSDPSAGALCKIIEAACKLRYQKCLDRSLPGSSTTSPIDQRSESAENQSTGKSDDLDTDDDPTGEPTTLTWSFLTRARSSLTSLSSVVKTGFVETASTVKSGVTSSSSVVREGLSKKASAVKEGLSGTLEAVRTRTESYWTRSGQR